MEELTDSGAHSPVRSRRLPWRALLFVAYALAILAIGWSYALWHIHSDRAATLATSNRQLQLTATALGAQVEAMLNDGVGAANAAANVIRGSGGLRLPLDAQHAVLAQMATGGSYVHGLFIVHGNQLVLAPTGERAAANDTEQLRWLDAISRSATTTWIGPPVARDDDRDVEVAIARRVDDIGGIPAWAGAVIGWEGLDEIYTRLSVDRSTVAIVAESGIVLARLPMVPGRRFVGVDASAYEVTRQFRGLPPQPLVAFVAPDTLTGEPRQYAIRRIENVPIVAVAGRTVQDALIAWRDRRAKSLQVLAAGSVALLFLAFALYRVLSRRYFALVRSEERFALAVASTNDGVWEWDGQSGRLFLASRLLQLLQRPPRDAALMKPDALRSLVHPDDLHRCEAALRLHLDRHEPLDIEFRLRVGHDYRWFRARGQAIWDQRGRPARMAGAISDIHEGRLASQAVEDARRAEYEAKQEFARELILAQEQERKRLANELHDSVGQNLSLIRNRSLQLQRMELPQAAQRQAEALFGLASNAIEEVRSVAQNLRPLHIEEMGVTDAIDALVERLTQSSGLTIEAHIENIDDVLQGSAATHVFRIVQEATNNVLKHAQARHLWIDLERDLTHVRLTIRDDGCGFQAQSPRGVSRRRGGLGLLSMRERSDILGATLELASEPGQGTRLSVTIPIVDEGCAQDELREGVPAGEGSDD